MSPIYSIYLFTLDHFLFSFNKLLAGGLGVEAAPEGRLFPLGDQWSNGTQKRILHAKFYGP
jgi:hypothetical protein